MTKVYDKLYIDGAWVTPHGSATHDVINPATEQTTARVAMGDTGDVDRAMAAARAAFPAWSATSGQTRCELINKIADAMEARQAELADAISRTMGCPAQMAVDLQVTGPIYGLRSFAERAFAMEEVQQAGHSMVLREAVGVCAFINPWNYPLHQFVGKVAPALAAGCTMVVKPAEQTPMQDLIMAEIMDQVGLPAGVFNLVIGPGAVVGAAMASHPEVDMVSFTGSTRAGIKIAEAAAPTVKRVTQELGGKSPYIITESADLEKAVTYGVEDVMINSGQTCTALTRMLVPESRYAEAVAIARRVAEGLSIGTDDAFMGPMSSARQQQTVLRYIEQGLAEGAELVTGGSDRPEGLETGFYIRPTIFANVHNRMTIAREEIFGPVLCMIPYRDLDEAVTIANDTPYGLSSGVYAGEREQALEIARRLRAGLCFVQGAGFNYDAPFGGFKQSGNGREFGDAGLHEFVEIKSVQLGEG